MILFLPRLTRKNRSYFLYDSRMLSGLVAFFPAMPHLHEGCIVHLSSNRCEMAIRRSDRLSIDVVLNQPPCPGAAVARAAHGARAIARSVRLLVRTETLALYSRQSSVAHRGLRMPPCAARTSFHLLRS